MIRVFGLLAGVVVLSALVWGQQAAPDDGPAAGPAIRIVSPGEDAFVSGPVLLRALVDPPSRAGEVVDVTFFLDGQRVCHVERPPFECGWDTGPGIGEHLVRAVARLRDGSRRVHTVRTKGVEFADRVEVNVVQVTATVTDQAGEFVGGLTRGDFRVFEDDRPQTITHFESEHPPLEVIVAVDVSSSMGSAMATLKEAVKKFLLALEEGDQVTLLAFNDSVYTLARQETNPVARLRAIDRLRAWGGTALYDAVSRALDMLGRKQGRRSLVVFTDGEDQSSHASFEDVLERVEASDATVYMIGQGRGTEIEALVEIQQRLATISGGRAIQTADISQLDHAFRQIFDELSNQYLLAYPPTNTARDNTWRSIRVELENDTYHVRARQGYRAAPSTR